MPEDQGKPTPVPDDPGSHPEDDELPEYDDDAIVEAIQFPPVKTSLTRWVIGLVVFVLVIYGVRALFGPGGITAPEQITTEEGLSYSVGDTIANPYDATAPLRVNIDEERYVELAPGASIRFDLPSPKEVSRVTLLNGRLLYTGPFLGRRAVINTTVAEIGTTGGRLFAELWGREDGQRLRVGILQGKGDLTAEEGGIFPLAAGKAAFAGSDLQPGYVLSPLYQWPTIDPRLDRWAYPALTESRKPGITDVIQSVSRQAGDRTSFPEWLEIADFSIEESVSRWGVHRAGDILDGLGMQWGFRFGIRDDDLIIIPLSETEHVSAVGEWALVNHISPEIAFWPDRYNIAGNETIIQRLGDIIMLSAAPLEKRLGALSMLIAYHKMDPGNRDADFIETEINLAFDVNQPYHLRRLAFEDLYSNPLVTPEEIVPNLETAGIDTAREYLKMRVFGPPAWGDQGVWDVYENTLAEKVEADESKAGQLYSGFLHGTLDYKDASQYATTALVSGDADIATEAGRFLHDISVNTPPNVETDLVANTLKSAFDARRIESMILGLDGIRRIAYRLDASGTLLWLIDPYVAEENIQLATYAAAAFGSMLEYHPLDDVDKWIEFLGKRTEEISDVSSEQSASTLRILGIAGDLEFEPCLTDESFIPALESRLAGLTGNAERLYAMRLISSQMNTIYSTSGLAWAKGETIDRLKELLSETDANFLIETILTLALNEGGYPSDSTDAGDTEELRKVLDNFFISAAEHPDPRLRWLALGYIKENKPSGFEATLATLADDEYPLIADTASG